MFDNVILYIVVYLKSLCMRILPAQYFGVVKFVQYLQELLAQKAAVGAEGKSLMDARLKMKSLEDQLEKDLEKMKQTETSFRDQLNTKDFEKEALN